MAHAEELCTRFFRKGKIHSRQCCSESNRFIFAFSNETDKLDMLVAKNSKIVYKAKDLVFALNKDNVVLRSPSEVICVNNGKSIIVKRKNCNRFQKSRAQVDT